MSVWEGVYMYMCTCRLYVGSGGGSVSGWGDK